MDAELVTSPRDAPEVLSHPQSLHRPLLRAQAARDTASEKDFVGDRRASP